jgi:hypothetical protein
VKESDGITKSIIDVANKEGIEVDVRPVLVSELVEASKDGTKGNTAGTGRLTHYWFLIKMCITNYQKSKILCGQPKR